MRQAVVDAWLTFTEEFEGGVPYLYADIRRIPTIAFGNAVFSDEEFARLPMVHLDGSPATSGEKMAAWHAVKNDLQSAFQGHLRAKSLPGNQLRLTREAMRDLALGKLHQNNVVLRRRVREWDEHGACVQTAIHSVAWACGPGFNFPRLIQALDARDFARAEVEIHMNERTPEGLLNAGLVPRNRANKILMRNAARVDAYHLDPDYLNWKTVLGPSEAVTVPDLSSIGDDAPTSPGGDNAASAPTVYPIVHADPSTYLRPDEDPDPEAA